MIRTYATAAAAIILSATAALTVALTYAPAETVAAAPVAAAPVDAVKYSADVHTLVDEMNALDSRTRNAVCDAWFSHRDAMVANAVKQGTNVQAVRDVMSTVCTIAV